MEPKSLENRGVDGIFPMFMAASGGLAGDLFCIPCCIVGVEAGD